MRYRLALWALAFLPGVARAEDLSKREAPSYAASTIVNLATGLPGPFAPNTMVALYGAALSGSTAARESGASASSVAPRFLGTPPVSVKIGILLVPLEYVSPEVVVFLIPPELIPGTANIVLANGFINGPRVQIKLQEFAPALFELQPGLAFARHEKTLAPVNAANPARPGGTIVLYAAGLGPAGRWGIADELPAEFTPIQRPDLLRVMLDGRPVEARYVIAAGQAARRPGCYEITLRLPPDAPPDPEITISMGDFTSPPGLRLPLRWPERGIEAQPAGAAMRSFQ